MSGWVLLPGGVGLGVGRLGVLAGVSVSGGRAAVAAGRRHFV